MMLTRVISSLSFQIAAGLLLPLILFVAASLFMIGSFQRQLAYDSVVDTAARLELTAQQLHAQAMNYKQNAPRDYPTYYRDVNLYYRDLIAHVRTMDRVVDTFMRGDFRNSAVSLWLAWPQPRVDGPVKEAIQALEDTWAGYRESLFDALGPDPDEPRLEYAAEHNIAHHDELEEATLALTESLRRWARAEHREFQGIALMVVGIAVTVALSMLIALYFRALAPLRRTIAGFERVANGDFGHRLTVSGATEVRQLTDAFNRLSGRLHVLFRLLERLQSGNDLDEVISFLSQEFSGLLRIDWIGVVLFNGDQAAVRLEVSYLDGHPERAGGQLLRLNGTLLAKALEAGTPMHVPDVAETAAKNPHYEFLATLAARGMRDAIFLPLTPQTQTPVPAIVVFANRSQSSYDDAHLRFLGNIAQLVTHSFGRTVRLAEHGRLAAIGEFASGIAHELRTPISTINLAVDAIERLELPDGARKRIRLAQQEAARMRQLLDEILLYAKPIKLDPRPLSAAQFLQCFLDDHRELAKPRGQKLRLHGTETQAALLADPDRLTQILVNLTQNACEAAPEGGEIVWTLRDNPASGVLTLEVSNPGPPIPAEVLPRVTEPFFSTKAAGTGLGLAIVQRLTRIQGGELTISSAFEGTRVGLRFPRLEPETSSERVAVLDPETQV